MAINLVESGLLVGKGYALKEYIKIKKDNADACYVIYCQRCDCVVYCVGASGALSYRSSVVLASKHIC